MCMCSPDTIPFNSQKFLKHMLLTNCNKNIIIINEFHRDASLTKTCLLYTSDAADE